MNLYSTIVFLHILSGAAALGSFWTAALARKGGALHRSSGKVYLLAMLGIIATAAPLVVAAFLNGNTYGGLFLAYLVVLVCTSCWSAWFAIRYKREPARYFGRTHRGLNLAILLCGAGISATGLIIDAMLLAGFGLVGVFGGTAGLRLARRADRPGNWWLKEHYSAMIGNGVATHIAFLGIGLRRLLPELDLGALQMLTWFGPVAVAVIAGLWLDRRYGRPALAGKAVPVG